MKRGLYLCACKARHKNHNIVYQDIDEKYECDLTGDMMDIDVSSYDYVICTPPCNWWSKANPYYWHSYYSWKTINLLPMAIMKLAACGKPFIVENVINRRRFEFLGIYRLAKFLRLNVYEVGRHTYFTNVDCDLNCEQNQDFKYGGVRVNNDGYNQGGSNVYRVIEKWISIIKEEDE